MMFPAHSFLSMTDRAVSWLTPLNALVEAVVEKIAPKDTAAACSGTYCGETFSHRSCWASASCGTNKCIVWYNQKYCPSGSGCSCASPCYVLFGYCRNVTCTALSHCNNVW